MKSNSNNFISSSIQDIMKSIKAVTYKPTINEDIYFNSEVIDSLDGFKDVSDIIIANRVNNAINARYLLGNV